MPSIWFVRAGRESIYAEDFVQDGIVAIGWAELGEVEKLTSKATLLDMYRSAYPGDAEGRVQVAVSQIIRFMQELKVGDSVMTYNRDKQMYYLGNITSDSLWKANGVPELSRYRSVKWTHSLPRAMLSVEAKNMLGAILTLFLVKNTIATEILNKSAPLDKTQPQPIPLPAIHSEQIAEERNQQVELIDKAEQAIEDRIFRLDWEQMQDLVAGVLRAMGYRTTVSPRGSDRGVDIFASPDGLGLEEPRIFVEVKHRPNTSMGSDDLRKFLGGRSENDKCLYVSTGGFSKEARYEADRAKVALTLLGLVELRKLLVDYYDKLDEETKTLVPLKRIYVLAD
jgi:restriction system protein